MRMIEAPTDPSVVYVKTGRGVAQLKDARDVLRGQERQLLILVDGRRTAGELATMFGAESVVSILPRLHSMGLVYPVPPETLQLDASALARATGARTTQAPATMTARTTQSRASAPRTLFGHTKMGERAEPAFAVDLPSLDAGSTLAGPTLIDALAPSASQAGSPATAERLHAQGKRRNARGPGSRLPLIPVFATALALGIAVWFTARQIYAARAPAPEEVVAQAGEDTTADTAAQSAAGQGLIVTAAPAPSLRAGDAPPARAADLGKDRTAPRPALPAPLATARDTHAAVTAPSPAASAPAPAGSGTSAGATPALPGEAAAASSAAAANVPTMALPTAPVSTPAVATHLASPEGGGAPAAGAPSTALASAGAAPGTSGSTEHSASAPTPGTAGASRLKVRERVMPEMPLRARRQGIEQGVARVRMHVNPAGNVTAVDLLSAKPEKVFDESVRATLSKWTFEPPERASEVIVEVVFRP